MPQRNEVRSDHFLLRPCINLPEIGEFDCGDDDLNEYFTKDAREARAALLTQVFELVIPTADDLLVGLVALNNDAVSIKDVERQICEIPDGKRYPTWPAVKIARLGTQKDLQSTGGGTELLNMLKEMFTQSNRTGCRIMTVDAYNNERTLNFYLRNDFQFLTEKDNKPERHTRAMWFDLARFKS